MKAIVGILVVAVIALVGALMFILGRGMNPPAPLASPVSPSNPGSGHAPIVSNGGFDRRVGVGGMSDMEACGSVARVVGLNPRGDNFLAVKSGPSLQARRTDKLGPNSQVYVCETTRDGAWTGVVYDGGGELSDRCGVASPVPTAQPYRGPCQSGWVSSKYLEIVAG